MPLVVRQKRDRHKPRKGDRHKPRKGDRHFRVGSRGRFVIVDGEGFGPTYALLADSDGHEIVNPNGLSSETCFEFLVSLKERSPRAVYVGFALGYDINHWVSDLSTSALYALWRTGSVRWEDWWIQWAPTRWFRVKHLPTKRSVWIQDSFAFFQSSFLKACAEWGLTIPEEVRAGKAGRREFTRADFEGEGLTRTQTYNRMEMALGVELMNRLREGFRTAGSPLAGWFGAEFLTKGIELNQWYGAGAAATWLLARAGIKRALAPLPPGVEAASLGAYFGGRIEAGYEGRIKGPIYNLDLRSAYPDALRRLPDLSKGHWEKSDRVEPFGSEFAVYRVEWDLPRNWPYYPLPWRDKEGAIYFPRTGRGWYWAPEAWIAQGLGARILEGWRFVETSQERPFAWVGAVYQARKGHGPKSGAGKALKLGMNALYGKTCQREGIFGRVPTFRNWAWAGYVTSYVRAHLWRKTDGFRDKVISFATDGIYATDPLLDDLFPSLNEDKGKLGDWERTVYDEMDIVMAGVYRLRKGNDWELYGRGFGKTGVPWESVLVGWKEGRDKLTLTVSRFHTLGECIHVRNGKPWIDRDKWKSWTEEVKELRLRSPSLKRIGKPPTEEAVLSAPYSPTFGAVVDSTPHDPRRSHNEELAET